MEGGCKVISIAFLAAAISLNGKWNLGYRLEEERGAWSRVEASVPCDGYLALQEAGDIR